MGGGRSGQSRKKNARLMRYVLNDLHVNLGLEPFNLAHFKMHTKPHRKLVQFRPLNAGYSTFTMELGLVDSHKDVVGRVATKLHLHPEKIKLAPHNCSCNLAGSVDPEYQFESLREALVREERSGFCDVLHYYVVGAPPRKPKTSEDPNAKQEHAKSSIPVIHAKRLRNFPRGFPKKGQGRHANKRKITLGKVEDDVLDNPKRLKGGRDMLE